MYICGNKTENMSNRVAEIWKLLDYNETYSNKNRAVRALNSLLQDNVISIEELAPRYKCFLNNTGKKYTVSIKVCGVNGKRFRFYIKNPAPIDVLRSIAIVFQKKEVKEVLTASLSVGCACNRCGGKGVIHQYKYWCNGICFECYGTGKGKDQIEYHKN